MSWNYRICAEEVKSGALWYSIRDVYYTKKKAHSFGADPQPPQGSALEFLEDDFNRMKEAFNKPVLLIDGEKISELKEEKKNATMSAE